LGLIVLMCLSAQGVNAAEAKKKNEGTTQSSAETQQQIEQAQRDAEALRQQAQDAQQMQQQLAAAQQEKKSSGPEPSLNLPIRYYVYTAVLSGLGYATGFLSRGPERELRDPAKHPTQDKTLSLYRRAYYGGLVSKGFYSLSGTMGAYAAYKTQSSIRQYITAKAQAQMAQRQREAAERLAQATSPEEKKAAEVTNALLVPSEPMGSEPVVLLPEPPPVQIGLGVGPSVGGAFSLSVQF
jgi:hypothetical protein